MKKIFLLLILSFLLLSCEKNTTPLSVIIEEDKVKLEAYLQDAKRLYIRDINTNPNHLNYRSIELDITAINKIHGYIKAVYSLKSPQSDTVFNIHKIHIYETVKLSDVTIAVQEGGLGMANLMKGVNPSGNVALDLLLRKYGLVMKSFSVNMTGNNSYFINLKTPRELNIAVLEEEFKGVEGVIYPVPFGGAGDGNQIRLKYEGNKAILEFSYAVGDCPAGCINRTYWVFEIENNIAKFIGKNKI